MQIIISPAKMMVENTDTLPPLHMPVFLNEAKVILNKLKELDFTELKRLYKASDNIVSLNLKRLSYMDLNKKLTPALFSYSGLQYQSMGANVFDEQSYKYLDAHLFILSGFYGLLRPFDGVTPYRLEMASRLKIDSNKDLYSFWQDKITNKLLQIDDTVINLASDEYSKVIAKDRFNFINVFFMQDLGGKLVERGTLCKQARGAMVRFLAEKQAEKPEGMKDFTAFKFAFCLQRSDDKNYVFIQGK